MGKLQINNSKIMSNFNSILHDKQLQINITESVQFNNWHKTLPHTNIHFIHETHLIKQTRQPVIIITPRVNSIESRRVTGGGRSRNYPTVLKQRQVVSADLNISTSANEFQAQQCRTFACQM